MNTLIALLTLISLSAFAQDAELPVIEDEAEEQIIVSSANAEKDVVLEAQPINVDGYMTQKPAPVSDPELQTIRQEIERQKKEIVLNKVKAKEFKELGKSTEALSNVTEEMLEEKRAVQEEIANYNLKVKCLQQETPTAECEKFNKRRR